MQLHLSKKQKRATNLTIDADLLIKARELGVNLSSAAEAGLVQAVSAAMREKWLAENRQAIECSNAYIDANGLPLARYRQF